MYYSEQLNTLQGQENLFGQKFRSLGERQEQIYPGGGQASVEA